MKKFVLVLVLLHLKNSAQEIFPGGIPGTGGSYNLTFPNGTCFIPNRPIGNNNSAAITKGPNYSGPFQTHQWWNSALWHVDYMSNTQSLHSGVMHPHPLMLEASNDGYVLRYRNQDYQAGIYDVNYFTSDQDLKVGLENRTSTQTQVDSYGHWHTKLLQQTGGGNNLYMTAATGCPFVFFDKQGSSLPIIYGGNLKVFLVSANSIGLVSNTNSFSYPDKYFVVTIPSGTTVSLSNGAFVAPNTLAINSGLSSLRLNLPAGKEYFSVAILPDNSSSAFNLFTQHGQNFITETDFSYSYNEATANLVNTFTTTTVARDGSANEGTLQALYRHHYLYAPEIATIANTGYTYRSPRGEMKLLKGNIFTSELKYHGLLPMLGNANKAEALRLNALVTEFSNRSQITTPSSLNYDLYNTFIAISQAARMAEVAHQVGNTNARNKCLDAAKFWIESWLRSPAGEVCRTVHYAPTFNWLTCYPDAFQADIGMHDSHFMYGYLIHGAAMVARFEKKRFGNLNWVNQWKPMIDLMIRNINDWNKNCSSTVTDGNNPCFPFLRYYDPYAGHSWALNYTESQESVSEAVQFAAGAALWGDITGNTAMRDMGIMLFVNESEAGRQYWYDVDLANSNRAPFAPDYPYHHAGIVYNCGAKYGTFFGTEAYQIHGITYWAISGASVWMGKNISGLQNDYNEFLTAYGGNINGTAAEGYWSTEMLSAMALFNPSGATSLFNSTVLNNDAVFSVNAEMNAYRGIANHWIRTLDSVGTVDASVRANTDFYSVFYKNNCRHYMVWNAGNQPGKTVTFTDGKQFYVPSDSLMVVKDCNLSALPVELISFTANRSSENSVLLNWNVLEERNVWKYELEKSEDAEHFQRVSTLHANHNRTYSSLDHEARHPELYYRLKIIDNDGSSLFSEIIHIKNILPESTVQLAYFDSEKFTGVLSNKSFEAFDLNGKKVGDFELSDRPKIPAGIYVLKWK